MHEDGRGPAPPTPTQLLITLEPEAAALHTCAVSANLGNSLMEAGEVVMVVDAGGGACAYESVRVRACKGVHARGTPCACHQRATRWPPCNRPATPRHPFIPCTRTRPPCSLDAGGDACMRACLLCDATMIVRAQYACRHIF